MFKKIEEEQSRHSQSNAIKSSQKYIQQFIEPKREPTKPAFINDYTNKIGSIFQLEDMKKNFFSMHRTKINCSLNLDFVNEFAVNVQEYDSESILVELRYGRFARLASILTTDFFFNYGLLQLGRGQYGSVFQYQQQGNSFVFKAIDVVIKDGKVDLNKIYREFFMAFLASCLQVGPKLVSFFKYDIVIINNKAWFSMEKCSKLASSMKTIEADLTANLKTLHSLGFMHMDIKPDNVAFSPHFNKVVFLDFGFSQLIQEPLGFKTLTKYSGTLAYCSEEMRALYYLEGRKYVDLYYNDLVGLQRTLKEILGYNKISLIIAEKINAQEHNMINQMKDASRNENIMFGLTSAIVFIKYFIFIENVDEVIKLADKNPEICSSIFTILTNEHLKDKIRKNSQIQMLTTKLKNRIIQSSFKLTQFDRFFMSIHSNNRLSTNIISVYHILQLSKSQFISFLNSTLELQKLFFIFNPISNYFPQDKSKESVAQICSIRIKIIQKIYQVLEKKQTATIFYQKVSSVTHYFYKRLGPLNNKDILYALRAMFILLYDPIFVQLDQQIIKATHEQNQMLQTAIEFIVFRRITKVPIGREDNKQFYSIWKHILDKKKTAEKGLQKELTLSDHLSQLLFNLDKETKKQIIGFVSEFGSAIPQLENFVNIQTESVLCTTPAKQFMHKIYNLASIKRLKTPLESQDYEFTSFCKVYRKLQIEQKIRSKLHLRSTVKQMLTVSSSLKLHFYYFLFSQNSYFIGAQDVVFEDPAIFLDILTYYQEIRLTGTFYDLYSLLRFSKLYLQIYAWKDMNKQQKDILDMLIELCEWRKQKFETISEKLQERQEQIMERSLSVSILVLKKVQHQIIYEKMCQVWQQFLNLSSSNSFAIFENMIVLLSNIYPYFEKVDNFLLDRLAIELTQKIISSKSFAIFQFFYTFLKFPIVAYNRLQNYNEAFQIIHQFVLKIKFNKAFQSLGSQWICIKEAAIYFCSTADIYFVELKFNFLRQIPLSQISPEQAFLQFFLFYRIYSFIGMSEAIVLSQVLRMWRALPKPHFYVKDCISTLLYKIIRKLNLIGKVRKILICLRRERNYFSYSQLISRKLIKMHCLKPKFKLNLKEKLTKLHLVSVQRQISVFFD